MYDFKTIKIKIEDYKKIKIEAAKEGMKIYEYIHFLLDLKENYLKAAIDMIKQEQGKS